MAAGECGIVRADHDHDYDDDGTEHGVLHCMALARLVLVTAAENLETVLAARANISGSGNCIGIGSWDIIYIYIYAIPYVSKYKSSTKCLGLSKH